jgi:hypothetical protein
MHEVIMVRRRRTAYMILADVEFLHVGQTEQQRPHAADPQQHARLPRDNRAPIVVLERPTEMTHVKLKLRLRKEPCLFAYRQSNQG